MNGVTSDNDELLALVAWCSILLCQLLSPGLNLTAAPSKIPLHFDADDFAEIASSGLLSAGRG